MTQQADEGVEKSNEEKTELMGRVACWLREVICHCQESDDEDS